MGRGLTVGLDMHEERIRHLEAAHTEVAVQLATQCVQISSLYEDIARLDRAEEDAPTNIKFLLAPLAAKLDALTDKLSANAVEIATQTQSIQALEAIENARKATRKGRIGHFTAWIIGAVIALTATAVTELITRLFK